MRGQSFYTTRRLKSGVVRLYKTEAQSLISWRGDNDKVSVVRDSSNKILNFKGEVEASDYCRTAFGSAPFKD